MGAYKYLKGKKAFIDMESLQDSFVSIPRASFREEQFGPVEVDVEPKNLMKDLKTIFHIFARFMASSKG